MVTNSVMHTTFFDSARDAAWKAIKELGDRIKCGMLNTQNDLREEKKHNQELEATNQRLREDMWHPAKTTTRKSRCFCALHHRDRMLMSSCHIAFEHRHHLVFACIKLFADKPSFVF